MMLVIKNSDAVGIEAQLHRMRGILNTCGVNS